MKNGEIAKAEREVIKWAMARLKTWKRDNPKGLIPFGEPSAVTSKAGHNMIAACLRLEKLRAKRTTFREERMKRDLLALAVGAALAMPQPGLGRESSAPKMRDGERGIVGRRKQIAAYKRQRAADRARRKSL